MLVLLSFVVEEGLFFFASSSLNGLLLVEQHVFFGCCCSFKLSQSLGLVCVRVETCRLLQVVLGKKGRGVRGS